MPNNRGRRRRFGAVRELSSGQWQARYKGPDGLMRPADRTFPSKTDAEVWLTLKEAEIRNEDWIDPDAGRVPFAQYAKAWIEERPDLRPKTIQLYRYLLRRHLLPGFDSKSVAEIKEASVRRWRKKLLDAQVSPVTTAKAYRLLKAIMNTAVDDGLIRRNPCRIKGAGQEKSPERPVLTIAQVYALADAIDPRYRALVLLGTFGSLRWGELAALRRKDVDLKAFTIRVERQLTETVGGGSVIGPPKSNAGLRTVPLPTVIAVDLDQHLDRYAQKGDDGLVFTSPTGTPLRNSNFRRRVWLKATERTGLDGIHFHDLRHAGNAFTAEAGANLRELMARMGHSSTRAAMVYLHSTDERQRTLADTVDKAARTELRKAKKKPRTIKKPCGAPGQSGTEVARNRKRAS
jgi:integrase